MKVLIYLGHPAHYHLFKNVMLALEKARVAITVVIKSKDVLEALLRNQGVPYINIMPKARKPGKLSIAAEVLIRDKRLFDIVRRDRPTLMIGTSAEIAHIGRILRIPNIVVNEDDYDAVLLWSSLAYPLANYWLAPACCRVGRWKGKVLRYNGYHELAYLHPTLFVPDRAKLGSLRLDGKRFFLLRFVRLSASHDVGKQGIDDRIARTIIKLLEPYGRIYISSERILAGDLEPLRVRIPPEDIHHILAFADICIGDSQTMIAEAAVLGTPALRFNDFVRRISYLDELEQRYGLTYGYRTSESDAFLQRLEDLVKVENLKQEWRKRRDLMLAEKIRMVDFLFWLISEFPDSAINMRAHSSWQEMFR